MATPQVMRGRNGGYLDNRWFTGLFKSPEQNRPAILTALQRLTHHALLKFSVDDTTRQELESDALFIAAVKIGKFDPSRNTSALSYFTSVVRNAATKALAKRQIEQRRIISYEAITADSEDN